MGLSSLERRLSAVPRSASKLRASTMTRDSAMQDDELESRLGADEGGAAGELADGSTMRRRESIVFASLEGGSGGGGGDDADGGEAAGLEAMREAEAAMVRALTHCETELSDLLGEIDKARATNPKSAALAAASAAAAGTGGGGGGGGGGSGGGGGGGGSGGGHAVGLAHPAAASVAAAAVPSHYAGVHQYAASLSSQQPPSLHPAMSASGGADLASAVGGIGSCSCGYALSANNMRYRPSSPTDDPMDTNTAVRLTFAEIDRWREERAALRAATLGLPPARGATPAEPSPREQPMTRRGQTAQDGVSVSARGAPKGSMAAERDEMHRPLTAHGTVGYGGAGRGATKRASVNVPSSAGSLRSRPVAREQGGSAVPRVPTKPQPVTPSPRSLAAGGNGKAPPTAGGGKGAPTPTGSSAPMPRRR